MATRIGPIELDDFYYAGLARLVEARRKAARDEPTPGGPIDPATITVVGVATDVLQGALRFAADEVAREADNARLGPQRDELRQELDAADERTLAGIRRLLRETRNPQPEPVPSEPVAREQG